MGCGFSNQRPKISAQIATKQIPSDNEDPISSQRSTEEAFYDQIMKDVETISKPDDINPIVCLDINSFPLVVARLYLNEETPTNISLPIISASTYGDGRVVCFGSIEYMSKSSLNVKDTKHMVYNCLKWAVNRARTTKPALLLNIPEPYQTEFRKYLEKHSINTEMSEDISNFNDYRLIITTSSCPASELFEEFVNDGGALVCFFNTASDSNNGDDEMSFSMNKVLSNFGLGFTLCTLNVGEFNTNRIKASSNFSDIKDICFRSAVDDYQNEISKSSVSETILDDLVTTLRFYLAILSVDSGNSESSELIQRTVNSTWEYLKDSGYNSPDGLCPKISHSICIILLSQLTYKLPPAEIKPVPEVEIFPGKVGNIKCGTFKKRFKISSFEWVSTGLFLPYGIIATVRPSQLFDHVHLQIGAHHESLLSKQGPWKRWPNIIMSYPLSFPELRIASPYGGLVFIVIDNLKSENQLNEEEIELEIEFENFVECPRLDFNDSSIFDSTKNIEVPWAELDLQSIIFTIPSSYLHKITNQKELCDRFSKLVNKIIDFTSSSENRRPFRVVFDIELPEDQPVCGYPLVFLIDDIDSILFCDEPTPELLTLLTLLTIVSIRENCLDSITESAVSQIAASLAIREVWNKYCPLNVITNDTLFSSFWTIESFAPNVLKKTLEMFQNPNFSVQDTPEEKWGVFVREMCIIGRKDFRTVLQKERPIPPSIKADFFDYPPFEVLSS
ncbi:hypothetical protein TRFO_06975 [Tritrichomonas foetus]|uniref:Peptidase M60 domain-containing protein n=1 Tax=Tritrichomonas foetus TaxID=1144522 RepID=A0A1J4K072_9EUKA|nr:hypothetical protein TRFO_06975 [Tritrichomonas foetus]|eukprot:OHT02909.1 hypothetical protein TRFO_06975 [Tritrichomonas foetus]